VKVEDGGVPGRNQTDGVVDDGRRRVRGRRDGAHHAPGRPLQQGQAVIAAPGDREDVFHARGLVGGVQVLLDLVGRPAQAGLPHGILGQGPGLIAGSGAHGADDLPAAGQGPGLELGKGGPGRLDGLIHREVDSRGVHPHGALGHGPGGLLCGCPEGWLPRSLVHAFRVDGPLSGKLLHDLLDQAGDLLLG
jgi:hypothetical protein